MPGRSRKCRAPSGTEARRKPIQNHTDVFEQNVATHCSLDQQTGCSARARNSGMVLSFLRCCCSGKQAIRNTTFAKCIRETSSSRAFGRPAGSSLTGAPACRGSFVLSGTGKFHVNTAEVEGITFLVRHSNPWSSKVFIEIDPECSSRTEHLNRVMTSCDHEDTVWG